MAKHDKPSRADMRKIAVDYFGGRLKPFTPEEVQEYFGISDDTLYRWRKKGFKSFQRGNVLRYSVESIYEFQILHTF